MDPGADRPAPGRMGRPMSALLRQNTELRRIRVWNWTLPAATTTLDDGRRVNVCPAADACVRLCYARVNSYAFRPVAAAHRRNLERILDDLGGWRSEMIAELSARRFRPTGEPRADLLALDLDPWARSWAERGGAAVRIHDAGDFLNDDYAEAWLDIAETIPDVLFYAYTKEIPRFRQIVEPRAPQNFRWIFSYGGRFDDLIDPDRDRHADVFPSEEALEAAGYQSQSASDLLAALLPTTRIGIPANNIPHLRRRQGEQTFREQQSARPARRDQ